MTAADGEVTLSSLSEQIEGLTDLFRRRLLEDRTKHATIDDLKARLARAEKALAAESLRPFVTRVALLVERLQSAPPTEDLRASVIEELTDVLEFFGVITVGAGDTIDPRYHEIVSVTGEGSQLRVGELVRAGYQKDGVVLRAARVTAVRVEPGTASNPGGGE